MNMLESLDQALDLLIVEELMTEDDKKPLMKWFDKFEKALKKMGVNYSRSKISPTDAVEAYYAKKSPEQAAAELGGKGKKVKKEAMSDADLKKAGIDTPLKGKGYPYQNAEGEPKVKKENALHSTDTNSIQEQRRTTMFQGDSIKKKELQGVYDVASNILKQTRESMNVLPEEANEYIREAYKSLAAMKVMTPRERKKVAMEYMLKAEKEMGIKFTDEMKKSFLNNLGV
tara:strand:+ start:13259 stop:13945 length:687 start_codon:yes stop_codon:yes gene_type:complete